MDFIEKQKAGLRPVKHLNAASKLYPKAWSMVDRFLRGRGDDLPQWPKWCFLPMGGWYAIVSEDAGTPTVSIDRSLDISRLSAIGAWRYTQGIFRFDAEVFNALWNTSISGNLPSDVLLRLPQWSIYIETPNRSFDGDRLYGFWCHLEWDVNNHRKELRLLMDTQSMLLPYPLHLGDWPLATAVQRAVKEASRHVPKGVLVEIPNSERLNSIASVLTPVVSLILYLCSNTPDYGAETKPSRPQPKKTKKGWRLFAPPGPTIWRIGDQVGRQIRAANSISNQGDGLSVRPHIRSAHWHGFWSGPKKGPRKFDYRWLPPIPVNVDF